MTVKELRELLAAAPDHYPVNVGSALSPSRRVQIEHVTVLATFVIIDTTESK